MLLILKTVQMLPLEERKETAGVRAGELRAWCRAIRCQLKSHISDPVVEAMPDSANFLAFPKQTFLVISPGCAKRDPNAQSGYLS